MPLPPSWPPNVRLQKRAFYEHGFRSAGVKMYMAQGVAILKWYNVSMNMWSMILEP